MVYPNLNEEKKLWRRGVEVVVGLDEAGRGPLAGPVVAGAVCILKSQTPIINFQSNPKIHKSQNVSKVNSLGIDWSLGFGHWGLKVKDSKQLSEKKREELYEILTHHENIRWGVGIVSETVIDKVNILEATKLAMKKAVKNLEQNLKKSTYQKINDSVNSDIEAGFLLLDGNFKIDSKIPQVAIVKGDAKVFSIAAASIIAKVTRDRLMQKMHAKYPEYGFNVHKGYGTAAHMTAIKKLGPCKIHRKTFYPVSSFGSSLAKIEDI